MGTVMNGNVWAGACVNGKVVSGLAKDGSVFYRKPVSTHRRRIMVGDNLKGKDIFSTIPQGFWQNYVTSTEIINKVDYDLVMFQNANWNDYIRFYTNKNESLLPVVRLYDYGGIPNEIYLYQADINKETNNSKTTHKNDKDYIVSSIVENNVYRHLYIEDENIRPLKVGDKIVPGTKFYGVVPDDPNLNNMNTSIYDTNGNSIAYFNFSENAFVNELQVKTNQYSYTIMYSKSQFGFVNNSVLVSEVSYTIGDISDSQSNPNYKYLLVDTTTLGA